MTKRKIIIVLSCLMVLVGASSFKNDGFEIAKQLEIFVAFFKQLNTNYVDKTNPAELMNTAITAITKDLDPYTKFWTEQDVENSKIRSSGQYVGIGAFIKNTKDKRLVISEVQKGFPADKSGLKAGDNIIKIDDTFIKGYQGDPADLLKGESGSKAVITFNRQGKEQITSVNRSLVEIDAVPFYKLLDNNIGYVYLRKFNQKASSQVIDALKELEAEGANKIILDLRGNPGGRLNEAVKICNIFVDKDIRIVHTESVVNAHKNDYKTKNKVLFKDIPLTVLVNSFSASASEIVSGSMQDLDRGVVIGARSYGKGLVQRVLNDLKHGTGLKITTSRYFIPSGRCIQALDYWNRDSDDKPQRVKKSDYKEFKTKNGRTVYDGGGILPDVELDFTKRSEIASALLKELIIFDFATDFYYNHKFEKIEDFKFTDQDYQDFLSYIKKKGFKFETKTDELLEDVLTVSEKENFDTEIAKEYTSLKNKLASVKKESLKNRKKEIKGLIIKELLIRYFYRDGFFEYDVRNSEEIAEAKRVLLDIDRYNSILKND